MSDDASLFYELEPRAYTIQKLLREPSYTKNELIFRHGHIAITNYHMGDNKEFEKSLSVFDEMNWKYELKGGYYVKALKEFRINRGYNLQTLLRFFPNYSARVENDPYPSDKIQMDLLVPPRDDFQKVALTFMCSQGIYHSNVNYTQQMIDMSTGQGKALPDDMLVATPTGWVRMDQLSVGDYVLNKHGEPVQVLKIYPQGVRPAYEISVKDYDGYHKVICDEEHLWEYARYGHHYINTTSHIRDIMQYSVNWDSIDALPKIPRYHKDSKRQISWCPIIDISLIGSVPMRCILIDDPDHLFIIEDNFITHNTYCGVAVTSFLQARSIIIVPFGKLLNQWKQSFLDFTDIKEDEILIVQGSKTCNKILEGKYEDVKVFIFSADTIVSFHDKYGDLTTIEMLRATNAYVKIVDEVHRDMKAISMIEALSNFHMNYYMSASPDRSDKKESWIFKTCFKNIPRFGQNFKLKSDDHLNIIIKNYNFLPTPAQIKRIVNARTKWLNSKSYETELFNAPDIQKNDFLKSLRSILNWSKKNLKDGNKIMILCHTIDGTEFLQSIAEEIFPGQTSRYWGGLKQTEKDEALTKTVICATASSLGTGADIKGIQFVINTGTYANKIDAIQISGRARKIEGTEVFYIELVNVGYRKTYKQYESRKPYLIQKSKSGKLIVID